MVRKRDYCEWLEGITYCCLRTQTNPVTPRFTGQKSGRFATEVRQGLMPVLHFDVSGSCLDQTSSMDTGTSSGPQLTTLGNDAFDKQAAMQSTHNWIMGFFHAVPTRDLFALETKMHNRTFKSINETISLLLIFTTWLALSSLITTPKGLFTQKTSPHCSGNYHLNLFYFIKLLLFGYPRCGSTGMYTKQQDCRSLNQTLIRECHVSFKSFSSPSFFVPSSENKTRVIITSLPPLHIICEISHISFHTFSTPP